MKTRGITQLGKDDRNAANDFFNQLEQYGIFVVRNGALLASRAWHYVKKNDMDGQDARADGKRSQRFYLRET
jgi:hypothetical protein